MMSSKIRKTSLLDIKPYTFVEKKTKKKKFSVASLSHSIRSVDLTASVKTLPRNIQPHEPQLESVRKTDEFTIREESHDTQHRTEDRLYRRRSSITEGVKKLAGNNKKKLYELFYNIYLSSHLRLMQLLKKYMHVVLVGNANTAPQYTLHLISNILCQKCNYVCMSPPLR